MADRSEGGGAAVKVFVVVGNDFPDAVFSTAVLADQWVRTKQAKKPVHRPAPAICWRVYELSTQGAIDGPERDVTGKS